jgi:hypothetical protein
MCLLFKEVINGIHLFKVKKGISYFKTNQRTVLIITEEGHHL